MSNNALKIDKFQSLPLCLHPFASCLAKRIGQLHPLMPMHSPA
jgi:hypothetical protein